MLFFIIAKSGLNDYEQKSLLHLLRELAYADTKEEYKAKMDSLTTSDIYEKSSTVQRQLSTTWLGCTPVSIFINYE